MYSVVLIAAMATAAPAPNWHFRSHCHGSCACSAPVYGCHGCHGPVGYGWAGGCYGYHGGCYGGYGIVYADPYNPYGGCTGCFGCFGGHSGYGVPVPLDPKAAPPKRPAGGPGIDPYPPINPKKDKGDGTEEIGPLKEKVKKPESLEQGKAKIRIEVPAGGKLFVDGQHIEVAAGTRVFQTPALAQGQSYYYDIRIEVERDGATRREERRVVIRPGEDAMVRFPTLQAGVDTARVPR